MQAGLEAVVAEPVGGERVREGWGGEVGVGGGVGWGVAQCKC